MFVKDYKHLSLRALNNSIATPEGTCFPNFHTIYCTPPLFNLNSCYCILYLISISAITPFIFNILQLFHLLLPDFILIIHTYFHLSSFIFKTTNLNIFLLPSFFSPTLYLTILSNSRPSQYESTFFTVS